MEKTLRLSQTLAILLCLILAGCSKNDPPQPPPEVPFVREGTLEFKRGDETLDTIGIEIADDDSTRERGLMERNSLPDRSGMLFIFDEETPQRFWMANTRISLDLVFAAADGDIVEIARYTRPLSQQGVESATPALYVVEVQAGYTENLGLVVGDRIEFAYLD